MRLERPAWVRSEAGSCKLWKETWTLFWVVWNQRRILCSSVTQPPLTLGKDRLFVLELTVQLGRLDTDI